MGDWDENWLNVRDLDGLEAMMGPRLDLARAAGCDGVEPDNTDCYQNKKCWSSMGGVDSGSAVKAAQVSYLDFLASAAHSRGLAIGLKNTLGLVKSLVATFDFAINEQCVEYDECSVLKAFTGAGKAVFHVEYDGKPTKTCKQAKKHGLNSKYCDAKKDEGLCKNRQNGLDRLFQNCFEDE